MASLRRIVICLLALFGVCALSAQFWLHFKSVTLALRQQEPAPARATIRETSLLLYRRNQPQDAEPPLLYRRNQPQDAEPLLLYRRNATVRKLVQQLHRSGTLLKVVRKSYKDPKPMPQWYPDLDFTGYSFTSLSGAPLHTSSFINDLLLRHSTADLPVPNVVHTMAYAFDSKGYTVDLRGYLSLLSYVWLSGADLVVVWCNRQPLGRYWPMFVRNVTASRLQHKVVLANRKSPSHIFGQRISGFYGYQKMCDVMKIEMMVLLGGVFLDIETATLKSLEPLRRHHFVTGQLHPYRVAAGAMMAVPASPFVITWYMTYQSLVMSDEAIHCCETPYYLCKELPHMCHIEFDTMTKPWSAERWIQYTVGVKFNWSRCYMMHFWDSPWKEATIPLEGVRAARTVYGEVARFILYGG